MSHAKTGLEKQAADALITRLTAFSTTILLNHRVNIPRIFNIFQEPVCSSCEERKSQTTNQTLNIKNQPFCSVTKQSHQQ